MRKGIEMFDIKKSMTDLVTHECEQELDELNKKIDIINGIKNNIITSLTIDENYQFPVELRDGTELNLKLSWVYDGSNDMFDEQLAYYRLISVSKILDDVMWSETGMNSESSKYDIVKLK